MSKPRSKPRKSRVIAPKAPAAAQPKPVVTASAPAPKPPEPAPAPPPPISDWQLAFLALYAEDAFSMAKAAGTDLVNVRPDPRLAPRWSVLGTLTAVDAPLRIGRHKFGARKVFYGWHLQHRTGERVLAIRGTGDATEWMIDALYSPRRAHPIAGRVHDGFFDLFASLRIDGKPLTDVIGAGPITVVGHSLGAALATLTSLELAKARAKIRGVFVASPRVGDTVFAKAFGAAVPDHVMYRNPEDVVPRVPFLFGFTDVPNTVTLSAAKAGIRISGGWGAQHHVVSYGALMSKDALSSFISLSIDRPFLACITRSYVSR